MTKCNKLIANDVISVTGLWLLIAQHTVTS